MAVISKLDHKGQDITRYNNATIRNINIDGVDFHFAKPSEVENNICENAVNEPIIDMQIQGNSVQNGTPTPETPIEIESVGDLGKNLCGGRNVLVNKLIGNSANGIIVDSTVYNTMYIEVEEGQTYSFTGFVRADGSSLKGCFYDSNGDWVSAFEETTVTIPTGVKYVGRSFNNTVEQVQFEVGQPTEYEPYGYKIPVVSKGKNLFDISKAENGTINQTNGTNLSADQYPNRCRSGFIYLRAGNYTISFKELLSTGNYLHSYSSNNVSSWIKSQAFTKSGSVSKFTLDSDCYIRFTMQPIDTSSDLVLNTETLVNYKPQLEQGTTATEYELYIDPITTNIFLNEPLRKIGDFSDYIDYKNGLVVRKIASEFLDTVTTMSGDATTYRKFLTDIKYKPYLTYQSGQAQTGNYSIGYAISNKFEQSSYYYGLLGNNPNFIQTYITTGGINRCVYTFDDKSVQQTAQAQELIGDGFEVCYVMASSIEETIEVPEISTLDGTNTFEIATDLEPSGITINYWKQI